MDQRHQASEEATSKRRKTLGVGTYRATRVGRRVVLIAVGETPTPNYKVWLRAAVEPDKRHVHELWWLPPVGDQAQMLTPFSVHASFAVPNELHRITVRDAEGLHEIKIEPSGELAPPESKALVYLHYANQFDLKYEGKDISFTQANIAGDPLLTVGDRFFIGDQIHLLMTPIGEIVTVTMKELTDGDCMRLSLLLPPTRVSGYETVGVEAQVVESVSRGALAGPPVGPEVLYEKVSTVKGHATYIVS